MEHIGHGFWPLMMWALANFKAIPLRDMLLKYKHIILDHFSIY